MLKSKIYVVEDDLSLQELYTCMLETEFDCTCFTNETEFFSTLKTRDETKPDLVLLDIMLEGEDGFDILKRLKSEPDYANIPVILVSAKGDEVSKVRGLNLGANDYVAKPFGVLELIARIKANIRKNPQNTKEASNKTYKDIFIDTAKHLVYINDEPVKATRKEYNLLTLLCEHAEIVLEREIIFKKVWDEDYLGETRTLDIHIKELRKKLLQNGSAATINTIRGVGYILI